MIEAKNLIKWFGAILAVDDVSFSVQRGEVLGFLGPNGAGKSTTMRMITGFLPPSSGSVSIDGHDILLDGIAARSSVGYLPENAPGYPEMTVKGFLNFVAEIYGFTGREKSDAVARVVETCHLGSVLYQPIDTLSKGYRHRTCFAQSILPDPPILILDEPTDGLDPNQKQEVRELIKEMGKTKAIILSTHILEEVDAVCSRVLIIDRGKLVCNGTPHELREQAPGAGSVTVRLPGADAEAVLPVLQKLEAVQRVDIVSGTEDALVLRLKPAARNGARAELATTVAGALRAQDISFDELHTEPGRLEEIFRSVTRAEIQEEEGAS